MMIELLLGGVIFLLIAVLVLQVFVVCRKTTVDLSPLQAALESADRMGQRTENAVRDEIGRNREEASRAAQLGRQEVAATLKSVGDSLNQQLNIVRETVERRLTGVQTTVEQKLHFIQEDNKKNLEQMRQTVDEKLQGTLEKRLGESFKLVSERLEQVHKGLGEMQTLATGVGDLKRVLTNVRARGTWGEVQLERMLEEVFSPSNFDKNVATKDGGERVEFALRLPGRGDDELDVVWLPIDAKFPMEDYQRLQEAQENGNHELVDAAARQLEQRVKACACDISSKYLNPPKTTDFCIMFLPTEGLFAEVLRRPGLHELLYQESKVIVAGPTTLLSILHSFQVGFRTLAIQKRSSEVWDLLAKVKTEFGKYGDVLDKVKKKLTEAQNTIDDAGRRTRAIERNLRDVQQLPASNGQPVTLLEQAEFDVEAEPV